MHSEYDFLFPHWRRLKQIGRILAGAGAVLVGAVAMALVIGLPLQSRSNVQPTVSSAESSPAGGSSQKTPQTAADTAVGIKAGGVRAAVLALSNSENQSAAANAPSQTPTSLKEKSRPKTALSRLELASAYEPPAPVPSPTQPSTTAAVPPFKLPSGSATLPTGAATQPRGAATQPSAAPTQPTVAATQPSGAATQPTGAATQPIEAPTQPRSIVRRPKAETAANAPQPMPDRSPEPGRVRPEPFSIKEF